MQLTQLTLASYLKGLNQKKFSVAEVQKAIHHQAQVANKKFNLFVSITDKNNIEPNTLLNSPLQGASLAIKDNILIKNQRATASSKILDNFFSPYSATIINKLFDAGANLIGKTNMDAWAHGSSTETSDYGTTLNPNNSKYLPGGSSGGSAAAVSANACLAAIGTETAGSIRQPSSWCGVVGLKPTYGRVSRYGIVAMASSTDSPGPITKTVEDSAILLSIIAGQDCLDATSSSKPVLKYETFLNKPIKGLKIGVIYHDIEGLELVNNHMKNVIDTLKEMGANIIYLKAMDPHYAISVYTIVQRAEVSSNLARYDGIRYGNDRSLFGSEAKRRIMLGTFTLAKGYADQYYLTAQKVRNLFNEDFNHLFSQVDALIHPTSPGYAKKIGASQDSGMFGELEDMLLEPSSITGLPGISVPMYTDQKTNLSLGLNIIAPKFREDLIIQVADAYEKATPWNKWRNNNE